MEHTFEGGCACRAVRYAMHAEPMIVHCCHCRWCQRESGSAFAVNAVVETRAVALTAGAPAMIHTPSQSGEGQRIWRCPECKVALWSNYPQAGTSIDFVRVGTLDDPDRFPPSIHIYTASKQPWVLLPEGVPAVAEFYDVPQVWSAGMLARFRAARENPAPRA